MQWRIFYNIYFNFYIIIVFKKRLVKNIYNEITTEI